MTRFNAGITGRDRSTRVSHELSADGVLALRDRPEWFRAVGLHNSHEKLLSVFASPDRVTMDWEKCIRQISLNTGSLDVGDE